MAPSMIAWSSRNLQKVGSLCMLQQAQDTHSENTVKTLKALMKKNPDAQK